MFINLFVLVHIYIYIYMHTYNNNNSNNTIALPEPPRAAQPRPGAHYSLVQYSIDRII